MRSWKRNESTASLDVTQVGTIYGVAFARTGASGAVTGVWRAADDAAPLPLPDERGATGQAFLANSRFKLLSIDGSPTANPDQD